MVAVRESGPDPSNTIVTRKAFGILNGTLLRIDRIGIGVEG